MRLLTGWLSFAPQLLLTMVTHQVDFTLGVIIDDTSDGGDQSEFASCGDCFCITPKDVPCPMRPNNRYGSAGDIELLKVQVALNPFKLNCNPYEEANCQMVPPQNGTLVAMGEQAVCGIRYAVISHSIHKADLSQDTDDRNSNQNQNNYTKDGINSVQIVRQLQCPKHYHLISYGSFGAATSDGAVVTHSGACGACSTTKDLAAYLEHIDLTDIGSLCVAEGLVSFERGVECFIKHGLTETCAIAWIYDGYKTRDACLEVCVRSRLIREPNNGSPPSCELNECLQCDEDEAGPIFKQFAARTRRRSGLLSKIARPCNQIVYGIEHNPC